MWTPVLDGALADNARRAVRDIADDLATIEVEVPHRADVALFWAYAAGAFDDAPSAARYDAAVAALAGELEHLAMGVNLYGGLAGAGWVLAHVGDNGGELLAAIDRRLVDAIPEATPWDGPYDLIGGLVGLGVYFLERLAGDDSLARIGLGRVVDQLLALAETVDSGTTWHTPAGLLPPAQRALSPDGDHNCGVAHGVPGVIALLGRIAALPDPPRNVTAACHDTIRWLRAQELPPHPNGRFPFGTSLAMRARTAWCYGDPGIAATVWSAAARTGIAVEPWQELARACATRGIELCGVRDAGLCHGAFGLAHLYNRFFQASGDPVFLAGARTWFEHGLAMRIPGEASGGAIGGFRTPRENSPLDAGSWYASDELLVGASGIGLALLAALATEEPNWDRLLLCDLPTRSAT